MSEMHEHDESGHRAPIWKQVVSSLQRRMLVGLVTIIPIACAIFVIIFSINTIHNFFEPIITKTVIDRYKITAEEKENLNLPEEFEENNYFVKLNGDLIQIPKFYVDVGSRFLAIFLFVSALYIIGILSGTFIVRRTINVGENLVEFIPGIKTVYRGSKQLVETVVSHQKDTFREVVLLEYPRKNIWVLGYVTGKSEIANTGQQYLNIFVPTTPNPTSGFFIMAPYDEVLYTNLNFEEAVKYVVSAGIVVPEDFQTIPYKDKNQLTMHQLDEKSGNGKPENGA